MTVDRPRWRSLLAFGAAFLFLSALLNVNYPSPAFFSWRMLKPSLDVWLLAIVLAIAAFWGKAPLAWTRLTVWLFFMLLRLFRIGDTAVPMYLNRPLNLYIDVGYLYGLYDLLKTSARQGEFLTTSAAALTVAVGAAAASWYAWRESARALMNGRIRIAFLGGSVLILGASWIYGWHAASPPATIRLGREILSIKDQLQNERAFLSRLKETEAQRAELPAVLKSLEGADVLLFLVESYGYTVFNRPVYRKTMEAVLGDFEDILEQHGFMAVSTFLESPTYGGSSWLAHGTLESGVRVENDLEDKTLLRSALRPMAFYFRKSGYRTVSVMPGIRFDFPEGAYFGYDQVYYARHFDYRGPDYGWAPMPDQFVLDWVRRREFTGRHQPLFVRYVLVSSHAAYNIQPPFIEDWDRIGDGAIFQDLQSVYFPIYWPDLKNAENAYLHSLNYEFRILGDYLAKYVRPNTLLIIMGDHQPNLQLTDPGEPWSVPVHVISGNPRLVDPFRKRGYTPGMIPSLPPPHAGMETFLPGLLHDFR